MSTRFILLIILIFAVSVSLFFVSKSRSFQFFGEIYPNIETEKKVIALTFDDGPTNKTDSILSILDAHNVKATFFLNGNQIENHLEETKRIVSAGHEIGNHSYSHKRMVLKSFGFVKNEIERTDSLIRLAGYLGEIHFRPPHGKKLFVLPYYLKNNNRKTLMWDVEPEAIPKIAKDSDKITEYVTENAKNGSMVLLHVMYEGRSESVKSIPKIIKQLRLKGFEFKTVSEMLEPVLN